ncbi:hypothetical protein HDU97_000569 [Phlyctochytrium planicorne]|nr:hypothetical protein HDU97_000569 [Phlyctochytrium planicorne]
MFQARKDKRTQVFNQMADTALRNKKAATRLVNRFSDLPFRDLTTGLPTDNMIELGLAEDNQYERDLNDITTIGSLSMPGSPEPLPPIGKLGRIGTASTSSSGGKIVPLPPPPAAEENLFSAEEMANLQQEIAQRSRRGIAALFYEPKEEKEEESGSESQTPNRSPSVLMSSQQQIQPASSTLVIGGSQIINDNGSMGSRAGSRILTHSRSNSVNESGRPRSSPTRATSARNQSSRPSSSVVNQNSPASLQPRAASGKTGASRSNSVVMFAEQTTTLDETMLQNGSIGNSHISLSGPEGRPKSALKSSIKTTTTEADVSVALEKLDRDLSENASVTDLSLSLDGSLVEMGLDSTSDVNMVNREHHKPVILPLKMDDVLVMENVKLAELKHISHFRWQMGGDDGGE